MTQILLNNISTTLASAVAAGDVTINVAAGDGAKFALATGGNTIRATLVKISGFKEIAWEIVDVTARSTDALTVTRAREGTTALTFAIGDLVDVRVTAQTPALRNGDLSQDFVTKDLVVYGKLQIALQPSFSAFNSATDANQTGNGAEATVSFDSEIFDLAGNFSVNTFTAPVVGRYLLMARVMLSNIVSATSILLRIATSNRSYYKYYTPAAAFSFNYFSIDTCALADMDAGDTATVTITVSGMAGNTVSINGSGDPHTIFSGDLLA